MKYQIKEFEKNILYYETAKRQLETYITAINNEFEVIEDYNPINHITTRIKSIESIVGKLKRKNSTISLENAEKLTDIVGARIIVDFIENIYEIINKIKANKNIEIVEERDYITKPKVSGYRAYHLIVLIPVSIDGINKNIYCEIQIRTIAMDFWATNEHKLNYKTNNHDLSYQKKWQETAKKVWDLDKSMNELFLEKKKNDIKLDKNQLNIGLSFLKSIDKFEKLKRLGDTCG